MGFKTLAVTIVTASCVSMAGTSASASSTGFTTGKTAAMSARQAYHVAQTADARLKAMDPPPCVPRQRGVKDCYFNGITVRLIGDLIAGPYGQRGVLVRARARTGNTTALQAWAGVIVTHYHAGKGLKSVNPIPVYRETSRAKMYDRIAVSGAFLGRIVTLDSRRKINGSWDYHVKYNESATKLPTFRRLK